MTAVAKSLEQNLHFGRKYPFGHGIGKVLLETIGIVNRPWLGHKSLKHAPAPAGNTSNNRRQNGQGLILTVFRNADIPAASQRNGRPDRSGGSFPRARGA